MSKNTFSAFTTLAFAIVILSSSRLLAGTVAVEDLGDRLVFEAVAVGNQKAEGTE